MPACMIGLTTMDLGKACDALRGGEIREIAALVVQDRSLQRVVAVWPMVRRELVVPADAGMDLADLWGCICFDERQAVELSGLSSGIGLATLRRARDLGLIYPDGSVHQYAKVVLQAVVKDFVSG